MSQTYPASFYAQNARKIARELLGARLVCLRNGERMSGIIVETEAYSGFDDMASHGHVGKTPRNLPMWEGPGRAYLYLIYGRYWLLNVVCEPAEQPAAVLLRAIEPLEGEHIMAANRPHQPRKNWTNGPGRLSLALGLDGTSNRLDMSDPTSGLWIEPAPRIPDEKIQTGARVGMGKNLPEPWYSMPWRWWVAGNPFVSR